MTPPSSLSPKQLLVWRAIVDFINRHGYSPTIGELQVATGASGRGAVSSMLNTLERKGVIIIQRGRTRGILLAGLEHEQRARADELILEQLDRLARQVHQLSRDVHRVRELFLVSRESGLSPNGLVEHPPSGRGNRAPG